MLRQLKDFSQFFANPNFGLSSTNCSGGLCAQASTSSELQAAILVKGHVADLIEEADKHRRLLDMHVFVCRWLEQWQQPPVPGQPKRGKRRGGRRILACPPPFTFVKLDSGVLHGYVFDPDTQIGVGIDPCVTQAVSARDERSGQLVADKLARWKLTKGQVKHASGLNNARRDTERWLAPIKPHFQHLAAASSAGTYLEANLKHPGHLGCGVGGVPGPPVGTKEAAAIRSPGPGAGAVLKEDWKPPAGQMDLRLLRPAWSQHREQPVRGLMWCPVVAPRKPPQAPGSSQEATPAAASEPGPSTPPASKRSKRTKAEQAAEPTQPTKGKGKGKANKTKPAPQPGKCLDRDCKAALNMKRIGESRWRPLELCYWPEQGKLPAKGKEYPEHGYKRLRDKPPKAQQQQQ
ncbi:hypothetical protein QJQ45_011024 [Haematococcus lacustris]|nr:hypothetical protein QJQ45_011024 [Haematococcus lacustris]